MLRWFPRTQWISLGIKCIETQLIFFFFQARLYWDSCCSRREWEQVTGSLAHSQAGVSWFHIRGEGRDVSRPKGWLVMLCAEGMSSTLLLLRAPCFCSQLFRSGIVFFNFLYFLSIISSTCTSTLFLVPYESESVSHSVMSDSLWLRGL